MTGMDDLVTWLRAQLDRREGEAKAALRLLNRLTDGEGGYTVRWEWQVFARHPSYSEAGLTVPGAPSPTEVLAEIDAKRRILDLVEAAHGYELPSGVRDDRDDDEQERDEAVHQALLGVARLLAQPYAERDGYREEWRP